MLTEEAMTELRQMFPRCKYFGINLTEGAPAARYKVIIGSSYYDPRTQFFNSETLDDAMEQVRSWKGSRVAKDVEGVG